MTIELEEVKTFMRDTLAAHSEESRKSMSDMSTAISNAVVQVNKNENQMENMQSTLQVMREESLVRTAMLTTNLDNITSTVRETNVDVKALNIESAVQNNRIKVLEDSTDIVSKTGLGQYSTSILVTVLLVFVIGMFAVGNIDVIEDTKNLID